MMFLLLAIFIIIIALLLLVILWKLFTTFLIERAVKRNNNYNNNYYYDPYAIQPCPNPHCVRCQRYELVNRNALRKLPWLINNNTKSTTTKINNNSRVIEGVKLGRYQKHTGKMVSPTWGQYPTVLLIPNLTARADVTSLHRQACTLLENNFHTILSEYEYVILTSSNQNTNSTSWVTNDVPTTKFSAEWKVLHLLNQGRWNTDVMKNFPNTTNIVQQLKIMDRCIFGNIFFSKIYPNTIIEPHCGPTNARHRLHLTLLQQTSNNSKQHFLQVCDTKLYWDIGKVFVFDDSLRHSVNSITHRVVLIIDLFHPELTQSEVQMIRDLYPA